jgi:hypothetical protein
MRNPFKRPDRTASVPAPSPRDPFIELQQNYWSRNPNERAHLMARETSSLQWHEMLRLHHLNLMEMLEHPEALAQWMDGDVDADPVAPDAPISYECLDLSRRLTAPESPYRLRYCLVWQGDLATCDDREPNFRGMLQNASITHLGCLEMVRIDEQGNPKELVFVPLDDIISVAMSGVSLFRAGRVFYEDGTDEVALFPLLYGLSWATPQDYDHDGSMARFCCHMMGEGLEPNSTGIGLGNQDLTVLEEDDMRALFGLGKLTRLDTAVEANDPRFDEKCLARGLDPTEVRRDIQAT